MRATAAISLLALYLSSMCVVVSQVGKPRKPVDGGTAVTSVLVSLACMVAVYWLWKGCRP